jgi:neutral ceramidase
MWRRLSFVGAVSLGTVTVAFAASEDVRTVEIGAARVDITAQGPITLAGYPQRSGETTEVLKPLSARALALGAPGAKPVVLIVAEVTGVTADFSAAVAAELEKSHGLERARVAVLVTHTHTAPGTTRYLPFGFGRELPAAQAQRIADYTDWLRAKLVEVGRAALSDRRPGRLEWAEGRLDVAVQRRRIENGRWVGFGQVPEGKVDRALAVLRAVREDGSVHAVLAGYACHCTTLGGLNAIHPDWAGEASARLEAEMAGAVALVAIGSGADAGPVPRGSVAAVEEIGRRFAAEVRRVSEMRMRPLPAPRAAGWREIGLPLDRRVTVDELRERRAAARKDSPEAFAVGKFLARLEAGSELPAEVPYPVQAWRFGEELAMVFLGGEVVGDYALRLKRELPAGRVWVSAYANDVACYVPSRAMFDEGGYEVDASIVKYGWPVRLGAGTEDRIVATVHELLNDLGGPSRAKGAVR